MELAALILALFSISPPKLTNDTINKIKNKKYSNEEMLELKISVIDTYKKY